MPFISASVISPYNSIRGGAKGGLVPVSLLLDLYPGAVAAYSLRKLSTAYTGPAIEVRKTVAGETFIQDIGFLYDGSLDTESLLTFADGEDVFVAKWYDQSGSGRNATNNSQSTQPRIVNSGVIELLKGNPSIYAESKSMVTPAFKFDDANGQCSAFGVHNTTAIGAVFISDSSPRVNRFCQVRDNDLLILSFDTPLAVKATKVPYTLGNNSIFSSLRLTTGVQIFNNGVQGDKVAVGTLQQSPAILQLFHRTAAADLMTGHVSELILYPSDQSANREAIETNINNHYTIY